MRGLKSIRYCSREDQAELGLGDVLQYYCDTLDVRMDRMCSFGCPMFLDNGHPIYVFTQEGKEYSVATTHGGISRDIEDIIYDVFGAIPLLEH